MYVYIGMESIRDIYQIGIGVVIGVVLICLVTGGFRSWYETVRAWFEN